MADFVREELRKPARLISPRRPAPPSEKGSGLPLRARAPRVRGAPSVRPQGGQGPWQGMRVGAILDRRAGGAGGAGLGARRRRGVRAADRGSPTWALGWEAKHVLAGIGGGALVVVAVLAHLEHPGGGVGGLIAAFSLCAALYAGYTEVCRIGRREAQIITLQEKVRELMQSRRAAGLLRLEADVRRRRQDFPQPPFSGATAALARRRAGRRNPLRQVDYRRLCISSLEALVAEARRATAQGGGVRRGAGEVAVAPRAPQSGGA